MIYINQRYQMELSHSSALGVTVFRSFISNLIACILHFPWAKATPGSLAVLDAISIHLGDTKNQWVSQSNTKLNRTPKAWNQLGQQLPKMVHLLSGRGVCSWGSWADREDAKEYSLLWGVETQHLTLHQCCFSLLYFTTTL